MIFEIVKPFPTVHDRTYFKCINTHNALASENAWDLWNMLYDPFMRHTPTIVNFGGYENCVEIRNNPAPYLKYL